VDNLQEKATVFKTFCFTSPSSRAFVSEGKKVQNILALKKQLPSPPETGTTTMKQNGENVNRNVSSWCNVHHVRQRLQEQLPTSSSVMLN